MRRARLLLPVAAGVLGLVAGVVTALVAADDPNSADPVADPLHLGIPMVDLDCSGESLLLVAQGSSIPPLAASVANHPDLDLRYLRPDKSCDTLYAPASQGVPDYAVYAGPYDGMPEPCELRMRPEHRGDAVTNLTSGNESFVKCLCALPVAGFPDLTPGMDPDPAIANYVRSLQSLLIDLDNQRELDGEAGPFFRIAAVTGIYDEVTQARIEAFQDETVVSPSERGSVLDATWKSLTDDACKLYEY